MRTGDPATLPRPFASRSCRYGGGQGSARGWPAALPRMSIAVFILKSAAAAAGLALRAEAYDSRRRLNSGSAAALGASTSMSIVAAPLLLDRVRSRARRSSTVGRPRIVGSYGCVSRRCRTPLVPRVALGVRRREERAHGFRPRKSRTARRAPTRRHPSPRGRRPSAPRASEVRILQRDRTARCRACRTGSAWKSSARRRKNRSCVGSSQLPSTFETQPGTYTRSSGPSPTT